VALEYESICWADMERRALDDQDVCHRQTSARRSTRLSGRKLRLV